MPEPVARADGGAPIAAGPSTTVATRAVSPLWHVGALCVLDGPIGETELVERVASGSRSLPGLHPEPGERGRRSPFDPREHVGTAALSPPGRHRDLSSALSEIWSRRLDPRRPLFQVILVQGLAGGESAVVVKAHRDLVEPGGGI